MNRDDEVRDRYSRNKMSSNKMKSVSMSPLEALAIYHVTSSPALPNYLSPTCHYLYLSRTLSSVFILFEGYHALSITNLPSPLSITYSRSTLTACCMTHYIIIIRQHLSLFKLLHHHLLVLSIYHIYLSCTSSSLLILFVRYHELSK